MEKILKNIPTDGDNLKEAYLRTRKSLIERLDNWEDQKSWDEFYRTYWRLIYSVGVKQGLSSEEAFDVVQETILNMAKQFKEKKYDSQQGSFKSWLMNLARWRIIDQWRKRSKEVSLPGQHVQGEEAEVDLSENIPDLKEDVLEKIWDAEWQKNMLHVAIERVKARVSPKQFQIFDYYVVKQWNCRRIVKELGITVPQVYLAKHRVVAMLKKEVESLERQMG